MNHTRPMCCSTVCVCVYLLNVYPMALQNSTVTPKVFWYERMLYRKTNCSLQCIHSVVGFEYFIFRWFVKIILIAMRLDGNRKWRWCVSESRIEVERRWEEWKKKPEKIITMQSIHMNMRTATILKSEFASNAIETQWWQIENPP